MPRIRLQSPTFTRDIDVARADDLVEAEGLTWARDGDDDGLPRYIPAASG